MGRHRKPKWVDSHYVTVYRLSREGYTDGKIIKTMDVCTDTFYRWLKERPAFRDALDRGREDRAIVPLKGHLPASLEAELKEVWDRLQIMHDAEATSEQIASALDRVTERDRKRLFVHALLCQDRYNETLAANMVGVSYKVVAGWKQDPEFTNWLAEAHKAKCDFIESALLRLCAEGNPPAIIHAAKTLLRDRGYGEVKEVRHSGEITVNHAHTVIVSPEELELPYEVADLIYKKLEEKGYQKVKALDFTPVEGEEGVIVYQADES